MVHAPDERDGCARDDGQEVTVEAEAARPDRVPRQDQDRDLDSAGSGNDPTRAYEMNDANV